MKYQVLNENGEVFAEFAEKEHLDKFLSLYKKSHPNIIITVKEN